MTAKFVCEDCMEKPNSVVEKIVLFSVFFVFAVLVVVFAYGWDDIVGKKQDDVVSFAYSTVSKDDQSVSGASVANKVNINTATEAELDALPGIGEAKAKAIVQYRNENGKFKSISDIKNVKGIGDGIFNDIKGLITVG